MYIEIVHDTFFFLDCDSSALLERKGKKIVHSVITL